MELIDKAALEAAIKKRLNHNGTRAELDRSAFMAGREKEDEDILSFLDTLEVKEVEEPSKDLDEYKEVSFELIPYSANIAVGGNEYFLQAKVTDKDLSQIGVNGFLYKLKLKVKA